MTMPKPLLFGFPGSTFQRVLRVLNKTLRVMRFARSPAPSKYPHARGSFLTHGLVLAIASFLAAYASVSFAEDRPAAPPENLQQLDEALAGIFKDGAVPGAAVAIVENDQVVFRKAFGYADTSARRPVTPETVFRAGSISKSLTSIAIMTAVENGKLSLDDKLSERLPELKFNNRWEATHPIQLVHLLEHTTGWPDISFKTLTMEGNGWSLERGVQFTSPELVSRWPPGQFSVYNNTGPAVAGRLLEKASGQDFNAYLRDHVLRPLGMASADFELTPALSARLAKSYLSDGREAPFQTIILGPSGSLDTSVTELAQLLRFYLGRGTIDGQTILSAQSVERIERGESSLAARAGLTTAAYGLGNTPSFDKGVTFRGHNGQIDAFTSVYAYTLQNHSGYVLMANGGAGVDFGDPASRLVQSYLTRHLQATPTATTTVEPQQLEKYAGLYRRFTPDNAFTRPFQELLGLTRVSVTGSQLKMGGKDYLPVNAHLFRRFDRDDANVAFVENDGEVYKVSASGTMIKEPLWRASIIISVLIILAITLVTSVVMSPVWLVAWARGRLTERGGALLRFLPLLALITLGLCFALPFLTLVSGDVAAMRTMATPGAYSIAIMLGSLLFPLLSALGLWRAIRETKAGLTLRSFVALASCALLVFSAYAASIGWVGVRLWTM